LGSSPDRTCARRRTSSQNLCGIGILWTYGYYNQARGEDRELAIQFRKKEYAFLQDTGIRFTVPSTAIRCG
jgi:glucan phosphorylase